MFLIKNQNKNQYLKTKITVLVDGLIAFSDELSVIEITDSNTDEVLKRYNPFESEIKLTKKQWRKLLKELKNYR